MSLTRRNRVFIEEYLQTWNASEAARRAGYSEKAAGAVGHDLLKKTEIAEAIRRRVADITVGASEGLTILTAQARGSLAGLLKVAERWTEAPRSLDEIVEETVGQDEKGNPVRLYRVRCLVIDLLKLQEPQYGSLVRKLKDSPKEGLTVELYDAQAAVVKLLEAQGVFAKPTASLNVDLAGLSDAELERVVNGEDPLKVVLSGRDDSRRDGAGAR